MAQIANLNDPFVVSAPLLQMVSTIANRFPVPISSIAFLGGVVDIQAPVPPPRLAAPFIFNGAVLPEGQFLEPTIGQIWPR